MKNDTFLRSYLFCINQNPTTFEMKIHFEDSFFFFFFKLRKSWMDCFVNQNKQHLSVATDPKLSPPVFNTFHTSKLRIYGDKKVVMLREISFHTCPFVGSVENFVYQTNNLRNSQFQTFTLENNVTMVFWPKIGRIIVVLKIASL